MIIFDPPENGRYFAPPDEGSFLKLMKCTVICDFTSDHVNDFLKCEKLEGESKKEDEDLMKPVGIRRTQSTKILDLAANLFQPSESIELTKKPTVERSDRTPPSRPSGGRKLPSRSQTCKMASPTAIQRRQSSDSFIRELLEMAKVEVNLGDEKPKKVNDFKSQICQASTKIARRKTFKESDNIEKPVTCLRSKSTHTPANVTTPSQSANNKVEELDPFVKEILNSGLVLEFLTIIVD